MAGTIAAFDTRADIGLVPARSRSTNIAPDRGGVALHDIGPATLGLAEAPHDRCRAVWRSVQRSHMRDRGYVDGAYTGAICPHGIAMAGRGFGVRTAANGTNDGNLRFYAIMALLGGLDRPNQAILDGWAWWIEEARRAGGAGDEIVRHRDIRQTSCPETSDDKLDDVKAIVDRPVGVHRDAVVAAVRRPDTLIAAQLGDAHAIAFVTPAGGDTWVQHYPDGRTLVVASVGWVAGVGHDADKLVARGSGRGVTIVGGTAEGTALAAVPLIRATSIDRDRPFAKAA